MQGKMPRKKIHAKKKVKKKIHAEGRSNCDFFRKSEFLSESLSFRNQQHIPTHYLREMLRLILQENSVQFNGKDFLQTHRTAMGTKRAASFANIFMAKIETAIYRSAQYKAVVMEEIYR